MSDPQTYATHRRFDPTYHFFLSAVYGAALVIAIIAVWKTPTLSSLWMVLVSVGLVVHLFKTRLYALRAQDRVIRLEETLRMARVLPEDLKARIGELRPGQFVGLRFASDAELADRMREALQEQLGGEALKKRIQTWRPDTFRV